MPRRIVFAVKGVFESMLRQMDQRLKLGLSVIGATAPLVVATLDAARAWQFAAALLAMLIATGCRIEIVRIGREAGRDFLTGLLNRRSLYNVLFGLLRENQRPEKNEATELCVALIDLDHFKGLNDALGHKAGDKALKIVAELLRQLFRGSDIAARLGGDEFVLVLPRTSIIDAARKLESLREQISGDNRLSFKDGQFVSRHITVSIGVAYFTCDEVSEGMAANNGNDGELLVEKMIHQADELLYKAKEMGRNRVVPRESPDE